MSDQTATDAPTGGRTDTDIGGIGPLTSTDARLVTVEQAAKALQIHPETVRRLARSGKLPSRKFGRVTRIDLEAILADPALRAAAGITAP